MLVWLCYPNRLYGERLTLNRWQAEFLCDLCVLDARCILERHTPHELGQITRTRNSAAASERLELDIADGVVVGVNADLQLHDIAACRSADKSCADVGVSLRHGANIARSAVVVEQC
jgi:hypothetical protein